MIPSNSPTPLSPLRSSLVRESLLTFSEAVRYLPKVNGRRHAPSTVYRWCKQGINGVRLEYIRVGRNMVTTREALERFFTALAAADGKEA